MPNHVTGVFFQANEESPLEEPIANFEMSLSLVTDKLQLWWETAVAHLPNIVVALLILGLAFAASRLVRSVSRKFLRRVVTDDSVLRLLSNLAGIFVVGVGFFMALSALQLDRAVTSLLAGAGVIGLALAFAFQDLVANFIAGVYMSVQRPLSIGDLVETNDTMGTIRSIDLRHTVLELPDGRIAHLPNREIFEKRVVNYSSRGQRRVDLEVGVSYSDDLTVVESASRSAVEKLEERMEGRPVEVFFQSFGSSSIDLVVRFWIAETRQSKYLEARSHAIVALKAAFDEHGITIPFPIRTLDFDVSDSSPIRAAWPPLTEVSETSTDAEAAAS